MCTLCNSIHFEIKNQDQLLVNARGTLITKLDLSNFDLLGSTSIKI